MVGPDYQGRRRRVGFLALALTLVAATLYGLAATSPPLARAATPLVADITDHVIRISTGFIGTKVVLFGSVEEAGDVVVLVRGPETPQEEEDADEEEIEGEEAEAQPDDAPDDDAPN